MNKPGGFKKITDFFSKRVYEIFIFTAMPILFLGSTLLCLDPMMARYFIFSGVVFLFWGILNKVGAIAEAQELARERAKNDVKAEEIDAIPVYVPIGKD